MELTITTIQFPEITLQTRDAHKLRGYFGNLFKEHSDLLHNHYADGTSKYQYPLVQYKVINKIPHLVGIEEGGELLIKLFFEMKNININGKNYSVYSRNITKKITQLNDFNNLNEYKFETLYLPLNQKNHKRYINIENPQEKNIFLNKQIQNNILSFYKGIKFFVEAQIMVKSKLYEKTTNFKSKQMLAFSGNFVTNSVLPDNIGIGKAVSRGFGTIIKF